MITPHWTEWVIRASFLVAGIIHLLPLVGLLGRPLLERAYGIQLGEGQDLLILMRHRALLFGLLAGACFTAVVWQAWRLPAGAAALISMMGFVLIAYCQQPHGAAIAKVAWIDLVAAFLLAVGLLLQARAELGFFK